MSTARAVLTLGAVLLALGTAIVATAVPAGATPSPVTDYASYPSGMPPGCPGGPEGVLDPVWSNGRGGVEHDLRRLDLAGGDVLTLTWSGLAAGCLAADGSPAVDVSLAVYDSRTPTFDPSVDQTLLDFTTCGPASSPCSSDAGRFGLSLTLPEPSPDLTCNFQAGGVLGLPLAVVGPNGSFYSQVLRGDDRPTMSVGETNFSLSGCAAGVTPTSAARSTTTTTAMTAPTGAAPTTAMPTTTSTAPTTTTSTGPTTTATSSGVGVSPNQAVGSTTSTTPAPAPAPAPPTSASGTASTATQPTVGSTASAAEVSPNSAVRSTTTGPGTEVEAATVSRASTLPNTGARHAGPRAATGLVLVATGGALLLGAWSLRRRGRPVTSHSH